MPVAMETAAGEGEGTGAGGEGDEGVVLEEAKAKEEPRQSTDGYIGCSITTLVSFPDPTPEC